MTTAVLDPLLSANPMGPRITYYDDATGERIELSTATLSNWAAKTGNLLRDEMGAEAGTRVAVLLPAHWQTAAVLFGIWSIGAEVLLSPHVADVALCTTDRLPEADDAVGPTGEVAVLSLDPFGRPAPDVPVGLTDYATAVRAHGDQITPEPQPGRALEGLAVSEVLTAAADSARAQGLSAGDRVMSLGQWDTAERLVDNLLAVLAVGGSLVQVANPDSTLLDRRRETEKVSRDLTP